MCSTEHKLISDYEYKFINSPLLPLTYLADPLEIPLFPIKGSNTRNLL